MKSFIIIYRAGTALQRTLVEKKIKSFSSWAKILGEYWFVKTDCSANDIYNMINPIVGLNGRVVVVAVKRNAGWNNIINGQFIKERI